MRTLALGLLLLPAIAAADVPRHRTTLDVQVDDPDKKVTAAVLTDRLLTTDGTTLDACWRKPGKMTVKVVFDQGKVAALEASGGDRETEPCIVKVLRAITLADSAGRVTATLALGGVVRPPPPVPPKVGGFASKDKKVIDHVLDRDVAISLGKFTGIPAGKGTAAGKGTGVGAGVGDGTGTTRGNGPSGTGKQPGPGGRVNLQRPMGDLDGYTTDEIDRVMRSRAGVFRACYQKELNRSPRISGKLVVKFKIGPDGVVASVRVDTAKTTLKSEAVIACIKANVLRLRFPAKGAIAEVVYPFIFSAGN